MNYQHAFHAGNFADVHKHIALTRVLNYLRQKPAAFRVIDTHAGAGRYDLLGSQAARSGEWRGGIERLFATPRLGTAGSDPAQALVAPYLDIVAALNPGGTLRLYPGSPLIIKALLRRQDRLIACELEPNAAASLKTALRGAARAKALAIDGWMALFANIPPKERRGLIVIDPPYEENIEFERLPETLGQAHRKWPNGLYLLWYPIKEPEKTRFSADLSEVPPVSYRRRRHGADTLIRRLRRSGIPKLLRCELSIGPARAEGGLTGSGLIMVNPPFPLERELRMILPALARWLAPTGTYRLDWLSR
jgi:23S rRNA (adenine2030-N6)-methyltransferase